MRSKMSSNNNKESLFFSLKILVKKHNPDPTNLFIRKESPFLFIQNELTFPPFFLFPFFEIHGILAFKMKSHINLIPISISFYS